ncbi:MAG TPA: glycosyltransferase family 39 protein [Anaerolineaceae bacterium]
MEKPRKRFLSLILLLLLSTGWKLIFLLFDKFPFNSDEAIVALMARHILQGERPVFFYGQAYMGALDAWLVAGGFLIFGQQVWVIRLVQTLLYLGVVATTFRLGEVIFQSRRVGFVAGLLLAVPAVNTTVYTTVSLGGYGEALLLGNLMLLLSLNISQGKRQAGRFMAWGVLAGLGLWANGLTLVFSAPAGLLILWSLWRDRQPAARRWAALALIALGVLTGAAPWWIYALQNGAKGVLTELFGNAVAVEGASWLAQVGQHLVSFVLFGLTALFGLRPPWDVTWLALPLLPLALAFWLGVIGWMARSVARAREDRAGRWLLLGVLLVVSAGFLFTPFGVDPSGRYFLPMCIPFALFAADLIVHAVPRPRLQNGAVALLLIFHAWGTIQSVTMPGSPGLTTQFYAPSVVDHGYDDELMQFLRSQGETRGYTNYWVAYPLAFRSHEELIFIPALPYHTDLRYTARDNRYAPYDALVEASPTTAYIVTKNPALSQTLRAGLQELGVTWKEQQIGDFEVYYHLSRAVRPAEMNLTAAGKGQSSVP